MKKIIFLLSCLLMTLNIFAQEQHVIEKKFDLPKSKRLDLDLKFGQDITVSTWNKSEVLFRAVLLFNEPGIEKVHTLEIDENTNLLSIETDYDFDKHEPSNWDCNQSTRNYYNKEMYCIKVNYELKIPVDAQVRIETIAGNIEVKDFKGAMKAKSISGYVDVAMSAAHQTKLKFRSVTGEIYTDFDVELDKNSSAYSKKLTSEINGGGPDLLSLETVSGDIFFRKL